MNHAVVEHVTSSKNSGQCFCRASHLCRDEGYTLVEVLIVVVMIGVLAALGIQSFNSFLRRERVNAVAMALYGWLNEVRQESLRLQGQNSLDAAVDSSCTISFESGLRSAGQLLASVDQSLSPTCFSQLAANSELSLEPSLTRGLAVNMSPSLTAVTFTPRTLSTNVDDIVIGLTVGAAGPVRCIKISAVSGALQIGRNDSSSISSSACSYSSKGSL